MDPLILVAALDLTLLPIMSALAGGGLVGVLLKFRPERESYIAGASKAAVDAMKGALEAVQSEANDAEQTIVGLRAEAAQAQAQVASLQAQVQGLMARVAELEALLNGDTSARLRAVG